LSKKIPAPLLTGEDAEIVSQKDGAQPSLHKKVQPEGLADSFLHFPSPTAIHTWSVDDCPFKKDSLKERESLRV
jgi:hypothetical protein